MMNLTATSFFCAPEDKLAEVRAKRFLAYRDAETQTLYRESSAQASSALFAASLKLSDLPYVHKL